MPIFSTKAPTLNNKSYLTIYESFSRIFSEFMPMVEDWSHGVFNFQMREIVIHLKNKCSIIFGCYKDNGEWIWRANLDISEKTKKELGITIDEE